MRSGGARRKTVATAALGLLLVTLTACGGGPPQSGTAPGDRAAGDGGGAGPARESADPTRVPGIGDRFQKLIPAASRQVVAVYGDGPDSADSTVVLYTKEGTAWHRVRDWAAHNGRKGWATEHREDDKRSPVGVFTLSDAGGVLPDPSPGGLPYTRSESFAAPRWWAKPYWHDFDYVIAIDYNRVKGTPPNDPTRPQGAAKGGSIWLHMDHGSGTSACVSLSRAGMEYLLRTLDPGKRPVVVMGDRAELAA
ncbi:L,D-transpeptidase family protein [Streptomyces sp. SHP 1-2]|uniref:L,D-transpeptidase family protein n=1 Tax=Streptomyces sp. SHP 1-2 TaxID=2769489 RepID=UPI0022380827|nr:L,D-transpeptidase family protein [Streptomyces sp. SHP 1-2]MCW5251245.1 L,D-transpeptidase family protein [Streptomyces sp. SHP 1-2]